MTIRLTIELPDDHPFVNDPHDYLLVTAVDEGVSRGPTATVVHDRTPERGAPIYVITSQSDAVTGDVPADNDETFDDGAHRLIRHRRTAAGKLLRAELTDRSRCYTLGEWGKVEVLTPNGTWSKVVSRNEVPTRAGRGLTRQPFDAAAGFAWLDGLLDEAELILGYA